MKMHTMPTDNNIQLFRSQFPILRQSSLAYLDSAATALTPQPVIDAVAEYYRDYGVSVHRGIYALSERATTTYEDTRQVCRQFLGCSDDYLIIFTHGTTEAINVVAHSFVARYLHEGDEIVITECEHHANIIPWQLIASRYNVSLRALPVGSDGTISEETLSQWIQPQTKLLAITAVSNVTAYRPPIERLMREAQAHGVYTLVDGAQEVPHVPKPMARHACDFYTFSAHKLFGPTGVGVLCARASLIKDCEPFLGGGNIVLNVDIQKSTWRPAPARFEAGTPNVAGVIGLKHALEWCETLDWPQLTHHEEEVARYAKQQLRQIPQVQVYGDISGPIVSFNVGDIHPHDLAAILDQHGVAVRVGHHCAQPYVRALGAESTTRASFSFYNQLSDVDALIDGIGQAITIFKL